MVIGIEGGKTARSLFQFDRSDQPVAFVVGNERCGIDPAILQQCRQVVSIPMAGVKQSLNVGVAFGIAAYWLSN